MRHLWTTLALLTAFILCAPFPAAMAQPVASAVSDQVSPWVWQELAPGETADFLVILDEQADLRPAASLPTRQARGRWVYETLWQTAQRSQAGLRAWLDARGVAYHSFYIVNALHVLSGDRALVQALAARADVARVEANPRIHNVLPEATEPLARLAPTLVQPNIIQVDADDVWALGISGQGIVVGGQDTGYDWEHPTLIAQYRGWDGATASHDYNWHDAIADSPTPVDPNGHGTHTMGTAVGSSDPTHPLTATYAIGVAPGARWIGCRNMNSSGYGSPATYLECFEFFLAPYPVDGTPAQGNPDLAPDVTNNSWGCPDWEGCSWNTLQAAVEAQRAAGIMTVVSAGNEGSRGCSTVVDPPAIYDAAYTIGATDLTDTLTSFSSRGPVTVDGSNRRKPDLVAPGSNIYSCAPGGGYTWMSGTSMAAPHVAGAVALLWSAVPWLRDDIDATETILNNSAVHIASTSCSSSGVPNNLYGWGRLDTLAAVNTVLGGVLNGQVDSSTGTPLAGAEIHAAGSRQNATLSSDETGHYHGYLISDTYAITVTALGHWSELRPAVPLTAGLTTTLDITLTAIPYVVSGTVTAASSGLPLSATVSVRDEPVAPVVADPLDGSYALTLTVGSYTLLVETVDYLTQSRAIDLPGPLRQDFALLHVRWRWFLPLVLRE